jgi:two-component system CheB/CheR fusion protein
MPRVNQHLNTYRPPDKQDVGYKALCENLLESNVAMQALTEKLLAQNQQLCASVNALNNRNNQARQIICSTGIATLFLDAQLAIQFFTPALLTHFNIMLSDLGRPLADLSPQASNSDLVGSARIVLASGIAQNYEIDAGQGRYYLRRIVAYKIAQAIEGVVITFVDISESKASERVLQAGKASAEKSSLAKSSFLACASHDLRQPLQTLKLLQGLLLASTAGAKERQLALRIGDTVSSMSGMLNAVLDINQIENGTVEPRLSTFCIGELLARLAEEFNYVVAAKSLTLATVPCRLVVRSDAGLVEQMLRNMLSNAIKYTLQGRILLGCRRRWNGVCVEIWDTGPGIPCAEQLNIFDPYFQLQNPTPEPARGLGLGLSIVKRLADLLGHPIGLRSEVGKGSVFSIDLPVVSAPASSTSVTADRVTVAPVSLAGSIVLVVDAARELRELLGALLIAEKYQVITVSDGAEALAWIDRAGVQPDLILADYNLSGGMNGLGLVEEIRQAVRRNIPAIILTGDTCAQTASHVIFQHCTLLTKPSKPNEVTFVVHQLLVQSRLNAVHRAIQVKRTVPSVIYIVESDSLQRSTLRQVMENDGHRVLEYASGAEFLAACQPGMEACLLLDAHLPDMSCIDLLNRLRATGNSIPTLVMGDESGVFLAVEAMKAGATDYVDKPFNRTELLNATALALEHSRDANNLHAWQQDAIDHVANLTARQRQIMDLVLAGWPSKNIASELGISQRTVENHRASIMTRTHSKSIPALARLAVAATHRKPAG